MRIANVNVFSDFARNTAESASDFATLLHNLILDVRDSYRPRPAQLRGPGRNGALYQFENTTQSGIAPLTVQDEECEVKVRASRK